MKKFKQIALSAALASTFAAGSTFAADGIEFSGHANIVTGWQHDDNDTVDFGSCSFGVGGLGCNSVDSRGQGYGGLGEFRGLGTPNRDTFNFYIDEIELDIEKKFGDNIRVRADIDFGRLLSGTPNTGGFNEVLEQGYVTVNIPMGNGAELLFGRFNAPIGYESRDRIDNIAISYSNGYRYALPRNVTGAKLYYAFNDHFDWSVYAVNNLSDTFSFAAGSDSAVPSWGTRFGFTWGEEGTKSTVGLSYAGGPENFNHNAHLTHIVDLDFMIHINEQFLIAGEALYRQDNVNFIDVNGNNFFNIPNSKTWAANLLLNYKPSEVWNLWFRYDYMHDINPTGAYTGLDQQINAFTLGAGYQITEGAKMKMEYRLDLRNYSDAVAAAFTNNDTSSISNSFALEFGYSF